MFELTGNQIRTGRELLQLSRWRLSTTCGVSPYVLRMWENAGDNPPSAMLPKLLRVLRYMRSEGIAFGEDGSVTIDCPAPTMKTIVSREQERALP